MSLKRQKPEDLNKLVLAQSYEDSNDGENPLIQVSHPNVPDTQEEEDEGELRGVENPVFTLGDEEEDPTEGTGEAMESKQLEDRPNRERGGSGVNGTSENGLKEDGDGGEKAKELGPGSGLEAEDKTVTLEREGRMTSQRDVGMTSQHDVGMPPLHVSASSPVLQSEQHHAIQTTDSLRVPDALGSRRHSLADDSKSTLSATTKSGSSMNLTVSSANLLSPAVSRSHSITWLEIEKLERRRGSTGTVFSEDDPSERRPSELSSIMSAKLKDLARRFSDRTERFKQQAIQPPTPSTTDSDTKMSGLSAVSKEDPAKDATQTLKAIVEAPKPELEEEKAEYCGKGCCKVKVPGWWKYMPSLRNCIDPQSRLYLAWLALISLAYMYNAIASTLRAAFRTGYFYVHPEDVELWRRRHYTPPVTDCVITNYTQNGSYVTSCFVNYTQGIPPFERRSRAGYETEENRYYWWAVDYFCDLLYIVDILLVRGRIAFIRNGLYETDRKECWKNYRSKTEFKLDLLSLAPLELLYLIPQFEYNAIVRLLRCLRYDILSLTPLEIFYLVPVFNYSSLLRLPRILRIHICWEFFDRLDQVAKSGYIIRVIRTMTYMLYLIHVEACGYYVMSAYEGFGFNDWVYSGFGNAYIHCVHLATKTATSIGNNPKPTETVEYAFMTVYWLSGVFVFAMLIGQIRDIFQSATAAETTYRRSMDRAVSYMQGLNVPKDLQDKVRSWFNYNWEHQKTLNENSLLDGLPVKMMADLQIAVHFQTLSKVQLFQDCEKNLLYDLVVKLQPVLYLPRDYICKKGEVGTEMYIVKKGQVEVVGGENDSLVFATLHEGSVFGEISLLGIQGGNRRTASVRSKGFSNLFVLTKSDFEAAMRDYPEAHKLLKKRSKRVLAKNQKKAEEVKKESEEIIIGGNETPKMVQTVISLLDPGSKLQETLRRGSLRRGSLRSPYSDDGSGTPTGSIRAEGDMDLLSNYSEDEILRVEMTERPLSSQDMAKMIAQGEPGPSVGSPEPAAVMIKMETLEIDREAEEAKPDMAATSGSEKPPDSDNNEVEAMNSANSDKSVKEDHTKQSEEVQSSPNKAHGHSMKSSNKIHPAEIIIERETGSNEVKNKKSSADKKKRSVPKLTRSNRIEPVNGAPPGMEVVDGNLKRDESVQREIPAMDESVKREIPAENCITCDVEVHREKSPSLTSVTKEETRNGDVPRGRESPDDSNHDTPV